MIWKILPYLLGILAGIYLNWFPVNFNGTTDPIVGLLFFFVGLSVIGLPIWLVSGLIYLILKSFNKNNSNRRLLVLHV